MHLKRNVMTNSSKLYFQKIYYLSNLPIFIGYFYVLFTLERPIFGRKRSMCAFLILSGICLCLHPLLKNKSMDFSIPLSLFGRFCANCSYTILNLFSAEQFPTVVRGVGVGFTLVISRIGTILAPYILLIGPYYPLFFGIAALVAGLSAFVLPETLGKPLPETIADGEELGLALFCFSNSRKTTCNSPT